MVFKRYIKRGEKVYGPYYYHSYRDKNGEVRKRYVGKEHTKKRNEKTISYKRYFIFLLVIILVLVILVLRTDKTVLGYVVRGVTDTPSSSTFLGGFSKLSGYIVSEIAEEEIIEEFEIKEKNAKLKIKKPKEVLGETVSKNKNERAEYERIGYEVREGLILYFDMLNYSEYIDEAALAIRKESKKEIDKKNESINETISNKTINESGNESKKIKKEIEVNITIPINETFEENITVINDTITNETENNESENSIRNEIMNESSPEIGKENRTNEDEDKKKEVKEEKDESGSSEKNIEEIEEKKKGNKITGIFGGILGFVGRVIENVNDGTVNDTAMDDEGDDDEVADPCSLMCPCSGRAAPTS